MVWIDGYDNWDKRGRSVSMVGEEKAEDGQGNKKREAGLSQ